MLAHSQKAKEHDCLDLEYDNFLGQNNKNKDDKAYIHITESLSKWAVRFNISHVALCALLIILKANKLDVPLDARTLLAIPKKSEIITVAGGQYYHFGISNMLCVALKTWKNSTTFLAQNTSSLTLRINIDGIPLANSAKTCLWPILAVIKIIPEVGALMVGVYHGATKPDSLKDYLHNFLVDLKKVVKEGFTFENKFFKINLPNAFICDAPARSFLKCVKGHGGYYGCERCIQKRQYYKNRIIYPETEAPLRNDTHFMDQYDTNH